MTVSLSAVILLGALVILLTRKGGLKVTHAVICALFGFYLASTSMAPQIREFVTNLVGLLEGLGR